MTVMISTLNTRSWTSSNTRLSARVMSIANWPGRNAAKLDVPDVPRSFRERCARVVRPSARYREDRYSFVNRTGRCASVAPSAFSRTRIRRSTSPRFTAETPPSNSANTSSATRRNRGSRTSKPCRPRVFRLSTRPRSPSRRHARTHS